MNSPFLPSKKRVSRRGAKTFAGTVSPSRDVQYGNYDPCTSTRSRKGPYQLHHPPQEFFLETPNRRRRSRICSQFCRHDHVRTSLLLEELPCRTRHKTLHELRRSSRRCTIQSSTCLLLWSVFRSTTLFPLYGLHEILEIFQSLFLTTCSWPLPSPVLLCSHSLQATVTKIVSQNPDWTKFGICLPNIYSA